MEHKQFPPLFCIRQYLYHTMYAVLTGQCKVPTSTGLESGGNRAPCGRQGLHHNWRREPERDPAFYRSCSQFVSQVLAAVRERTINYVQVNYPTLSSRTVSLTAVCTYLRMYVHTYYSARWAIKASQFSSCCAKLKFRSRLWHSRYSKPQHSIDYIPYLYTCIYVHSLLWQYNTFYNVTSKTSTQRLQLFTLSVYCI